MVQENNVAKLLQDIEIECDKALKYQLNDPPTREQVKKNISTYLESLKEQKGLQDSQCSVDLVKHTWSSLYPKLFTRILAIVASKLFSRYDVKPKWYHKVFPYKIDYGTRIDWEKVHDDISGYDFDDCDDNYDHRSKFQENLRDYSFENLQEIIEKRSYTFYEAQLVTPHEEMVVNVAIVPIQPVSFIKLECVITPNGVNFDSATT